MKEYINNQSWNSESETVDVLSVFGKMLISEVRDRTIHEFDLKIIGKMRDNSSQQLFNELQKMDDTQRQLISKIIPRIVDLSIHNMLCMIEEHTNIDLQIEKENIAEISDGLAGELYTEDGWIRRFSKQRYEEI